MNVYDLSIGFIGFGNMASAIADGLLKSGFPAHHMYACAKNWDKLKENTDSRCMNGCRTADEVAEKSDIIVIAVKPYMVKEVVEPIIHLLFNKIVVSVAAGCDFNFYEDFLPEGISHISTVPNIPVSVCEGVFICEDTHSLSRDQQLAFEEVFSRIALIEYIDTAHLSIGGTISGCGPAFIAMFIEALGDAGVKYGLTREAAYRLASNTVMGTGKYQLETGIHPGAFKDSVCSPGGTTIRGVSKLEEKGFRSAVISAVDEIEG